YLERWPLLLLIIAGAIVVGVFSGIYPAFALSSFKPIDALKGNDSMPGSSSSWLRQALVVFQFSISVVLIIVALIAQRQLDYMLSVDMGFDKEQTLVINGRNSDVFRDQYDAFKDSIQSLYGVSQVTMSSTVPGRRFDTNVASRQRGMNEDGQTFYYLMVDHDFIDTYDLNVVAGRGFSREMGSDETSAFILNESAYRALGWNSADEPIGQEVTRQFGDPRNVIGVVEDFNFQSLQYEIEPLILGMDASSHVYASIKMSVADIGNTVSEIERVWETYSPGRPFEFFFLDEDFDSQYRSEIRISRLLTVFTFLAIGIACMGLFALASFVTHRRRKEIAVRKVLGASTSSIITMLSYTFTKPVLVAACIAVPVSWYVGVQWLQSFAARISINWDIFFIATALALSVALLTVIWQAFKAAQGSPSISLRSE
ncbi:MAG: FtsX-like permease family protein, partial [Pseudomonadales bacterium]|nr:FtsX-like permease family protein [Pseudomonadales bacterium]